MSQPVHVTLLASQTAMTDLTDSLLMSKKVCDRDVDYITQFFQSFGLEFHGFRIVKGGEKARKMSP